MDLSKTLKSKNEYSDAALFRLAVAGDAANILSLDTDQGGDPNARRAPLDYEDRETRMGTHSNIERE